MIHTSQEKFKKKLVFLVAQKPRLLQLALGV
jgi:hypothetical protein